MSNLGNRPGALSAGTRARQTHRTAVINELPQKVDNKAVAVAEARIKPKARKPKAVKKGK